jgi:plastocyanin
MRDRRGLTYGVLLTALLAGCGGSTMTDPQAGGSNGGGSGAGNDGGGSPGVVTGPPAASVSVTVGNNFFRSGRNGTVNPSVDTLVAGGKVTWTWVGTSSVPHNVQSIGVPSFTSGALETGNGSTYELTFTTPGTYRYNCAVHGDLMTGTVVVLGP